MRSLLDISFIIALIDTNHIFHTLAHDWWAKNKTFGWASCPLTENGVLRIMSRPGYSRVVNFNIEDVIYWLKELILRTDHEFWADEITIRDTDLFSLGEVFGHQQLTDLYLLALASSNRGRLVTFDQRVQIEPVLNATKNNLVILTDR